MKKSIMLLLSFTMWSVALNLAAQAELVYEPAILPSATWTVELPDNSSPSETAYNEYVSLVSLPDWGGGQGNLRAAPPTEQGDGYAQKLPIGDASWWMALAALLTYALFKTAERKLRRLTQNKKEIFACAGMTNRADSHGLRKKFANLLILLLLSSPAAFALPPVANNANYYNVPREGLTLARNYNITVLNNASFDCVASNVTINITSNPVNGSVVNANFSVGGSKVIQYRSNGSAPLYVLDSLKYTITCNGETSGVATAYLHPGAAPENVTSDVCAIPAEPFVWGMQEAQRTTVPLTANTASSDIYAADLDNNGLPEIFGWVRTNTAGLDSLIIFHDGDLTDYLRVSLQQLTGTTGSWSHYATHGMASVVLSRYNDGKGAVIITNSQDGYLYGFEYDYQSGVASLTQRYKSDYPFVNETVLAENSNNAVNTVPYSGVSLGVTDFNGDGNPEVYIGYKIFSLDGLNYLAGMPDVSKSHYSYADPAYNNMGWAAQRNHWNWLQDGSAFSTGNGISTGGWSIAVDLDDDGKPELVCGGVAYKVNTTTSPWGMSVYRRAPELSTGIINTVGIANVYNDGRTSMGDFNNDGHIDILVTNSCWHTQKAAVTGYTNHYNTFYGWDVHNNTILFSDTIQGYVMSYPFVGDLDGDKKLDIGYVFSRMQVALPVNNNVATNDARLKGLAMPATFGLNSRLQQRWELCVWETDARTGMTIFDFNNDGKMEIVYRDMQNLRIMNANNDGTISNLMTVAATSGTQWEMPLVLDVDGDGAADIVATGQNPTGHVSIYKSSGSPWADARNVWHQYAYNPTFVNEDLSIPIPMFNPAEKIKQLDGSTTQPFNHFLQQVGKFNPYGETLNLGPNLLFNSAIKPKMTYNSATGVMTIMANILNNGDIPFHGEISLRLYTYDSSTGTYTELGNTVYGTSSSSLAINGTVNITFTVNNFLGLLPGSFSGFYLFINSNTNGTSAPTYPATSIECEYADNLTGKLSFTDLERIICEGATETLKLDANFNYKWYTTYTGGTAISTGVNATGTEYQYTKNSDERTLFFVETYAQGGFVNKLSPFRDTLFVYRAPDSLIWTGAYDSDWHIHQNWSKPAGTDNYPAANIPRSCTNVLIPDGLSRYPDLSSLSGGSTYTDYLTACCNRITFNHGGEVKQPDSLHYARAAVDVTFNSNRWYMWSPPLKDLYPGDIYINDKNPYNDPVFVYTKLFSKANPQTGYLAADWTGNFITPVIPVTAGDGMRVWIDDHQAASVHDPYTFVFPKWDAQHHIYGADNTGIWATYTVPSRSNNGRFIFDGMPNVSTKNFTIAAPGPNGTGVSANGLWLVGNPFMAHIDFAKFYAANSAKIKNQYRIMTSGGTYEYYYNSGAGTLTQYIAPMQSFIVEAQAAFNSLTFNGNMTVNRATGSDHKLRASAATIEAAPVMRIALADPADQKQFLSQIFIAAVPGASHALDDSDLRLMTNVYTNPDDEPTSLFSKSVEATPSLLSVNCLDGDNLNDVDIPLGLRGVKAGQKLCLLVQGQTFFADGYELNLFDKQENKRYNLRGQTWFYFDNPTAKEQLDDRFVIEVGLRSGDGVESAKYPAVQKTVVAQSYYDLTGRAVSNAAKGLLLRKSVYDDGTVEYGKVYVR